MTLSTIVTHQDLVDRAARWLKNTRRCGTVLTEASTWSSRESPDAIGWDARGVSVLVEAKISRADFRGDHLKPCRQGPGMGRSRYYMVPSGLVLPGEVPGGWGLLVVKGRVVRVVVEAVDRGEEEIDRLGEIALLASELRRVTEGWRSPGDRVGVFVEGTAG